MSPASTMMIATDAAKIGRSMKKFTIRDSRASEIDALSAESVRIARDASALIGGRRSSRAGRLRCVKTKLDPADCLTHQCSELGRMDGVSQHEGLNQGI